MRMLKMFKRSKSEDGFSLTDVMVAVCVMGVLMVIPMAFLSQQASSPEVRDTKVAEMLQREATTIEEGLTKDGTNKGFEQLRVESVGEVGALKHIRSGKGSLEDYELYSRLLDSKGSVDLVITYEGETKAFTQNSDGTVIAGSSQLENPIIWE